MKQDLIAYEQSNFPPKPSASKCEAMMESLAFKNRKIDTDALAVVSEIQALRDEENRLLEKYEALQQEIMLKRYRLSRLRNDWENNHASWMNWRTAKSSIYEARTPNKKEKAEA